MFTSLLIANRGEIACRITRTARRMGLRTIAVHSDADAGALHVREADEAVRIGPAPARDSYLRADLILEAARARGAQAIHPGYGFLSENAGFAEACASAGIAFVGPSPRAIRDMGLKDRAKAIAVQAGAPVLPGYWGEDQSDARLLAEAEAIGFPLLVKAVAGGGGRGIRAVEALADLPDALASARREALAAFGDDRMMLERLVLRPRHLEVQVFGDTHGNLVHLFERDCSVQRRRQKLIEEAPAPGMTADVRAALTAAALKIARAVDYSSAGTVEFVADGTGPLRPDGFWFLEMNTRLQVEHPVTEAVTGLDLVEWQLRVAAGEPLPLPQDSITLRGAAIEARIVAEDPGRGFMPSSGRLQGLHYDSGARVDRGYEIGDVVPDVYDSLLEKVITHGDTRDDALSALTGHLRGMALAGVSTNAGYLARLSILPAFASGAVHTGLIEEQAAMLAEPAGDAPRRVGLAAIAVQTARDMAADSARSPFAASDGWRLNAPASLPVRLSLGETSDVIVADIMADSRQIAARVGGDHAVMPRERIDALGGGKHITVFLRAGPTSDPALDATAFVDPDGVWLIEAGQAYVYRFAKPDAAADALEAGDEIKAPLPGRIAAVQAVEGDAVSRGQVLVVLEAMKMEHALAAPRDGVVALLAASVGRQVKAGDVLVALAEEG